MGGIKTSIAGINLLGVLQNGEMEVFFSFSLSPKIVKNAILVGSTIYIFLHQVK